MSPRFMMHSVALNSHKTPASATPWTVAGKNPGESAVGAQGTRANSSGWYSE
eukprot:CAMPEP_0171091966 /NCGR_PEP_ID=MMETSP0766_2-20121228/35424_1 /TAXON_ID=439317 /ORGANISM="Gambierdiscus australes, Strain CAWD 149" /LENGTH=51 /DNA_ID=CAMNT_0011550153 /DNA_START=141 /DNA_END=296 /DNA_ORIENTATION=-